MSYAVETKKRKFHRMLESLTKPSTVEPAAKKIPASPSPARERLPADLSIKKVRLSDKDESNFAAVGRSILKARASSKGSTISSATRPSFVPWDRERFLERLETFRRVDRWSPKPAVISEVEWAKRGWICTDVSRVSCVGGCGGSVVVKLPDELDELDGYALDKVQERKEVPTIHRLPLTNTDTAIASLQKRYSNISKIADKLPAEDIIRTPESFNLDDVLKIWPRESFKTGDGLRSTESQREQQDQSQDQESSEEIRGESSQVAPAPSKPIDRAAFALAFFGWDAVSNETAGLVGCSACFRRLGLWMYKPKDNGDATVYDALDVANEHMEYCPWISGKAQSGTGRATEKQAELRSGWELLVQALKVKHRRQVRSSTSMDTLRAVSETPSGDFPVVDEVSEEQKKASDREWWAKLRRMRQVLNVKSPHAKKSVVP
ncbi:uncharacterized protein AFUA_6G07680 [Aspergillus fumigatus Af293]|uniref:C3HC zinc finger protein n=1 Tax=Aspergillus fumigatus (strain ATCC MYA-4609 / CBS 101355 / FGSC A1100 / Af293) TaxID=330879 RepID=Q4WN43_ASPFU|nr:conserved hypothetical protein [Aspergillus fumigatus Af293]EAL88621.1 conserved hypothetical protein [Aspergillus fumigatus Af293]